MAQCVAKPTHTQHHKLITGFGLKTAIPKECHHFRKGTSATTYCINRYVALLMVAAQPRQVFATWPIPKKRLGQNSATCGQNPFLATQVLFPELLRSYLLRA